MRPTVEKSNANQAAIIIAVPAVIYQGIVAPLRYALTKKGIVNRPNATAAVNQNFTHKVIPKARFSFKMRFLTTRRA